MNIIEYIHQHLSDNTLADNAVSVGGGIIMANISLFNNITHILDVALLSFIGGASGLVGKLAFQALIDYLYGKKSL